MNIIRRLGGYVNGYGTLRQRTNGSIDNGAEQTQKEKNSWKPLERVREVRRAVVAVERSVEKGANADR